MGIPESPEHESTIIMRHGQSVLCLILLLSAANTIAAEKPRFPHVHQQGRIRAFYNREGTHAVDLADTNDNGVPDQVEDIVTQARAAHLLFVEGLGFPDPWKSERYRSAAFLDIHLIDKGTLGSNGVAYDELQRYRRPADPPGTLCLCFNVATSVKAASNLTPAHEYFHIVQNGASYFKNRWYTEGTARWSEQGLGLGGIGKIAPGETWPPDEARLAAIFEMSYPASEHYWNPLALGGDPKGTIPEAKLGAELRGLTYVKGSKVLKDLRLNGWQFIRDVLVELGRADQLAYRELGYTQWSEENQRSPKNSRYIHQAVLDVLGRRGTLPAGGSPANVPAAPTQRTPVNRYTRTEYSMPSPIGSIAEMKPCAGSRT